MVLFRRVVETANGPVRLERHRPRMLHQRQRTAEEHCRSQQSRKQAKGAKASKHPNPI